MGPPSHIAQLLNAVAQFNPTLAFEEGAHRLRVQHDTKAVVVLLPSQVGEVFVDFVKDGSVLFEESVEYYQGESPVELTDDLARVIRNFLLHEVQVAQSGLLLKRRELQSYRGGKWRSVFQ